MLKKSVIGLALDSTFFERKGSLITTERPSGANPIFFTNFRNKLECLYLASLSSVVNDEARSLP
jgi:hypothetical protein